MNTPSHVAISLLLFRKQAKWSAALAVAFGAVLPDISMFIFYFRQKVWLGTPENIIWSERYFETNWQLLFDLFHSIPIYAFLILALLALKQLGSSSVKNGSHIAALIMASALIHQFFDLPLHHFDAHSHFLPLSDWRFQSPVSYWDSRFYGHIFMWFELALSLSACGYVIWTSPHRAMRITAGITLCLFLAFLAFAFFTWA